MISLSSSDCMHPAQGDDNEPADFLWFGFDLPMQLFERDLSFLKFTANMIEIWAYEVVGESQNFIVEIICGQERIDPGLDGLELFSC